MLRVALASFVLSLILYVLGAVGVANVSLEIGRIFLVVLLVVATFGLVVDLVRGERPKDVF